MNSDHIESKSINILEGFFSDYNEKNMGAKGYIKCDFSKNDKNVSWDGSLSIYSNNESLSKEDFLGRIPIQIKGKKRLNKKNPTFPVSIADLYNYKRDGGVIFFVIDIERKIIYHKKLLPLDINEIFKDKEILSQKTRSISLEILKSEGLYNYLSNFLEERIYQAPVGKDNWSCQYSTEKLENDKLNISFLLNVNSKGEIYLADKHRYIYKKHGELHYEPICSIEIEALGMFQSDVQAVFYEGDGLQLNPVEAFDIHISKYITPDPSETYWLINNQIKIYPTKKSISYEWKGNIEEVSKSSKFMAYLYRGYSLKIKKEGKKYNILTGEKDDKLLKEIYSIHELCKHISKLFTALSITKEVDFEVFTGSDLSTLEYLYNLIVEKKTSPMNDRSAPYYGSISIGPLKIIIAVNVQNGIECYEDFFSDNIRVEFDKGDIKYPAIFVLDIEQLNEVDNIPFRRVIHTIRRDINEYDNAAITGFLLTLIQAYDLGKRDEILKLAKDVARCMLDNSQSIIDAINYYQVIRRERELSEEEVSFIMELAGESDDYILAAIELVIGDNRRFKVFFQKLSDDEQKAFKSYPIYKLFEYN